VWKLINLSLGILFLLDSIRYLFELKEVYREIYSPHVSNNDYMYDFCDGNYIRSNHLFSRNPAALRIIQNTDDVEIANPLRSHVKKHKATMFYSTLANIRPAFRSQLHAIQLFAIAKTTAVRRFGESKLLEDFVNTVNELSGVGYKCMSMVSCMLLKVLLSAYQRTH